jgi:hypothetical protein
MNLRGLLNFISGDLERKTLLCVLVPLIFMAYFGTLAFQRWMIGQTLPISAILLFLVPWNLRLALQSDLELDFALE